MPNKAQSALKKLFSTLYLVYIHLFLLLTGGLEVQCFMSQHTNGMAVVSREPTITTQQVIRAFGG